MFSGDVRFMEMPNFYLITKRIMDIVLSSIALIVLAIPLFFIAFLIRFESQGPAIYWSMRVGKNGVEFSMPKFRSMKIGTPLLPSREVGRPSEHLTNFAILRRLSLDEAPILVRYYW